MKEWKKPDELKKWETDHDKLYKLIEERITNFLGYGNPKSKIWFIGMEEGANEEERLEWYPEGIYNQNHRDKYYINWFEAREKNIKQEADKAFGDQRTDTEYNLWNNSGFPKLYKLLLFLLDRKNWKLEMKEELTEYLHDNVCLLEFNPIPFRKNKGKFVGTFFWTDYVKLYGPNPLGKFINYISKRRIKLIKDKIKFYHPEIVIFYGLSYNWCYLKEKLWGEKESNLYHSTITHKDETGANFKTHIFIIPHCSDRSANKYPEIGKRIIEISKN